MGSLLWLLRVSCICVVWFYGSFELGDCVQFWFLFVFSFGFCLLWFWGFQFFFWILVRLNCCCFFFFCMSFWYGFFFSWFGLGRVFFCQDFCLFFFLFGVRVFILKIELFFVFKENIFRSCCCLGVLVCGFFFCLVGLVLCLRELGFLGFWGGGGFWVWLGLFFLFVEQGVWLFLMGDS